MQNKGNERWMTMKWNDEDGNVFDYGGGGGSGGGDDGWKAVQKTSEQWQSICRFSTVTCCSNAYGLVQL